MLRLLFIQLNPPLNQRPSLIKPKLTLRARAILFYFYRREVVSRYRHGFERYIYLLKSMYTSDEENIQIPVIVVDISALNVEGVGYYERVFVNDGWLY